MIVSVLALCAASSAVAGNFEVGVGIADTTGPVVEVPLTGWKMGTGLLQRCRARAFVWRDPTTKTLVALAIVDAGRSSQLVTDMVVEKLEGKFPGKFSIKNVMVSITHTHSAVGGFETGLMGVPMFGVERAALGAIVDGTYLAISRAYNDLKPSATNLIKSRLEGASINRSPNAYLENPKSERDEYDGDTDTTFVQLNIVPELAGEVTAVVNWFAVHPNSVNITNTLVSGDNKGYASYLLEQHFNGIGKAGKGPFIAAFASSNLGDLSPQTEGALCRSGPDKGKPCSKSSTCNIGPLNFGDPTVCRGLGPGKNHYHSNQILGKKQSDKALELIDATSQIPLTGKIDFRHSYVLFPELEVTVNGSKTKLCWPAMGMSAPAGTTDVTSLPVFRQGTKNREFPTSFHEVLRPSVMKAAGTLFSQPKQKDKDCQDPKPILFQFGTKKTGATKPVQWYPVHLPVQILRVGCLFILSAPGEFTTMAGRRVRKEVTKVLTTHLPKGECDKVHVTIAGLANSYSGYITTREEYQAQRYEGASTFYGPNTLQGHIQELSRLAKDIATGAETTTGPPPQINPEQELNLIPPPKLDKCPWWHTVLNKGSPTSCFGNVLPGHDAKRTQHFGTQLQVKFRGANPRHNLRLGDTYMTLERVLSSDGGVDETEVVMTDSDYSTNFEYKREFGTNFVDGLNFCRKKEEGCNKGLFTRHMAAIGKIAERIIKSAMAALEKYAERIMDAENVITHKITQGDSNNRFMSIVNISHAIKATDDLSTNDVLCLGGGKSAVGTVTLTLFIPEADSERNKLFQFDKGEFKLCYHGDYKVTSGQKPVAFKSCSKKFVVRRKTDTKKIKPFFPLFSKRSERSSCRHNKN